MGKAKLGSWWAAGAAVCLLISAGVAAQGMSGNEAPPAGTGTDSRFNERGGPNQAVLTHLEEKFHDDDLKKEVGLLWLGADYAQLSAEFCSWTRSRDGSCNVADINRSAFVAWIDCAI